MLFHNPKDTFHQGKLADKLPDEAVLSLMKSCLPDTPLLDFLYRDSRARAALTTLVTEGTIACVKHVARSLKATETYSHAHKQHCLVKFLRYMENAPCLKHAVSPAKRAVAIQKALSTIGEVSEDQNIFVIEKENLLLLLEFRDEGFEKYIKLLHDHTLNYEEQARAALMIHKFALSSKEHFHQLVSHSKHNVMVRFAIEHKENPVVQALLLKMYEWYPIISKARELPDDFKTVISALASNAETNLSIAKAVANRYRNETDFDWHPFEAKMLGTNFAESEVRAVAQLFLKNYASTTDRKYFQQIEENLLDHLYDPSVFTTVALYGDDHSFNPLVETLDANAQLREEIFSQLSNFPRTRDLFTLLIACESLEPEELTHLFSLVVKNPHSNWSYRKAYLANFIKDNPESTIATYVRNIAESPGHNWYKHALSVLGIKPNSAQSQGLKTLTKDDLL